MGNKFSRSTGDSNLFCILYLVRIGVLVPGIKTENIHDFYRARVDNIEESERNKYKPIEVMRGYVLRDCKDYTHDYVRTVDIIGLDLGINWYHVALQFCEHNFDIDSTQATCVRLRHDLPSTKAIPFVSESQDNKIDVWYHMNRVLDKYEPRSIPQYRK